MRNRIENKHLRGDSETGAVRTAANVECARQSKGTYQCAKPHIAAAPIAAAASATSV